MSRRHFLVTYDVADDKRRDRIFEALKDHGDHIQYSVFLCDLSPVELATLRGVLRGSVHHTQDQVLLVDLGPARHELAQSIEAIGRVFAVEPRAKIV